MTKREARAVLGISSIAPIGYIVGTAIAYVLTKYYVPILSDIDISLDPYQHIGRKILVGLGLVSTIFVLVKSLPNMYVMLLTILNIIIVVPDSWYPKSALK